MPAVSPGTTGLVSWWSLDEASGDRADSHGSNHMSPVATPGNATGKVGSGVDLEASSSQYLTIAAAAQTGLGSAGSFSFGAWYQVESTGTRFVASKRSVGAAEFTITTSNEATPACYFYLSPGFSPHVISAAFPVGSWVFLVVGYNSATGQSCVSVNGAAPNTATRTFGGLATAPFSIGYDLSGGLLKFDGVIDEAFYYTRWLSDDELSWLYNSGAGRAYSSLSSAKGLPIIAHYHRQVWG